MNQFNASEASADGIRGEDLAAIQEWRKRVLDGDTGAPWPLASPEWVETVDQEHDSDMSVIIEYVGTTHTAGQYGARVRQSFVVWLDHESDDIVTARAPHVEILGDLSDPSLDPDDAYNLSESLGRAVQQLKTL